MMRLTVAELRTLVRQTLSEAPKGDSWTIPVGDLGALSPEQYEAFLQQLKARDALAANQRKLANLAKSHIPRKHSRHHGVEIPLRVLNRLSPEERDVVRDQMLGWTDPDAPTTADIKPPVSRLARGKRQHDRMRPPRAQDPNRTARIPLPRDYSRFGKMGDEPEET